MYRRRDVPRYDRIQGFEFLSDWYLLAWDTLVDELGQEKAEQTLELPYRAASKAIILNLREWGVITEGLDALLQTFAFAGQHTGSGGYWLQRSGDIGLLTKRSCLAAYCRHRYCDMRCGTRIGMPEELLPTHRMQILSSIFDGDADCKLLIAPKDSTVTLKDLIKMEKQVLEPVPISEAFREKLVSNYLYETWLIIVNALLEAVGPVRAEQVLAPSMRGLGREYAGELGIEVRAAPDREAALAALVFTRLNAEVNIVDSGVQVDSCPFLGMDRTICRLAHSFVSGLVGNESSMTITEGAPNCCQVRIR